MTTTATKPTGKATKPPRGKAAGKSKRKFRWFRRTKPATITTARTDQQRWRDRIATDYRNSPRMQRVTWFALGVLVTVACFGWYVHHVDSKMDDSVAQVQGIGDNMTNRVDKIAGDCKALGTCASFPLQRAQEFVQDYAAQAFTYNQDQGTDEQTVRLKTSGGPPTSGWTGTGSGYATVYPNSDLSQYVTGNDGNIRTDVGIVGVNVRMAGSTTAPFHYMMVVKYASGSLQILGGAIFSDAPTMTISGCTADMTTGNNEVVQQRLQQFEAGRTHQPNVLTSDYERGIAIPDFDPGVVSGVSVDSVSVCRPVAHQQPGVIRVIAKETFTGPTPGAQFKADIAYTMVQDGDKLYVTGIGMVVNG